MSNDVHVFQEVGKDGSYFVVSSKELAQFIDERIAEWLKAHAVKLVVQTTPEKGDPVFGNSYVP